MKPLDWFAALLLFFQLPVPLYWLVLHPATSFWRRHQRAAFWTAGLSAWAIVAVFLIVFHARLLTSERAPRWAIIVGLALVVLDACVFFRVDREMGRARLVGQAELRGSGEMNTTGLYAHVRHPRYAGLLASVLGVCLFAGTLLLWVVAAVWWVLLLIAICLEERELRRRFGAAYEEYARRVPRFLPFRVWPRGD